MVRIHVIIADAVDRESVIGRSEASAAVVVGVSLMSRAYRCEPPPGWRTRKKFVRLFIGRASKRRICSTSARSLSLRSALFAESPLLAFLTVFLLTLRLLQDVEHGEVFATTDSSLAFDYICQAGDPQLVVAKLHARCPSF